MTDIATNEPAQLRANTTWEWERQDLVDYPAGTWTLTYYFKNAAQNFSFAAAANGTFHRVTRTVAQTASLVAGIYSWVAFVTSGTTTYEVDKGTLEVLAKFDAAANLDDRSHARVVLEAIEAVIEGRATKDQQEYTIGNRSLKRTPLNELMTFRDKYRGELFGEQLAENARNGKAGGKLVVRF